MNWQRLLLCCLLLLATPLQAAGYRVEKGLLYTPPDWPQSLQGDLYLPEGAGPHPVVLLVHGGSWQRGRRGQMASIARQLAREGYAAFTVSYRLAPGHRFPAPLEDLQVALHWLRQQAPVHGLDSARIAAWGFSAGGHLVSLLATRHPEAGLRAVIAGAAPQDLRQYPESRAVQALLGVSGHDAPERYAAASPLVHVAAGSPPFFIYHGQDDALVVPAQAEAMASALQAAGVEVELFWLPGRGHVGAALFTGRSAPAAIRFLGRHLGMPREPVPAEAAGS